MNPKVLILPAISATCAALCVRALRAEGMSRSIGQYSIRSSPSGGHFVLRHDPVHVATLEAVMHPPPPREFRDNFSDRSFPCAARRK